MQSEARYCPSDAAGRQTRQRIESDALRVGPPRRRRIICSPMPGPIHRRLARGPRSVVARASARGRLSAVRSARSNSASASGEVVSPPSQPVAFASSGA